jgi:hypothetical protein
VATNVVPNPAPKPTAIQLIEQELAAFFKQREQAIANVHAIDGAIQGAQRLLSVFKAEAAKAETLVEKAVETVEAKAGQVVEFVKKEL